VQVKSGQIKIIELMPQHLLNLLSLISECHILSHSFPLQNSRNKFPSSQVKRSDWGSMCPPSTHLLALYVWEADPNTEVAL
jgi:hypothetical protein